MRDETELFAQVDRFISALAQCRQLGITVVSARDNELILQLPYSEQIIGNPDSGVIHGGAITTLMDTTAGAGVLCAMPKFELCPTLDLRVDYMRSAKPGEPVYARASCYRVTSNILFMRCEAYQVDRTVAHCVATFMRMGDKGIPSLDYMTQGAKLNFSPVSSQVECADNLSQVVKQVAETRRYQELIKAIPYAQTIGIDFVDEQDTQTFKLTQRDSNIGNPIIPAIHGGVIGGFMELSGALHLLVSRSTPKFPKIIDFSLDYLRAGLNKDTYAYCEVTRQGSRVANIEVHAWQDSRDEPIALARAHFLLES
ncbi:MAG: hotdog domain-containing protein [Oleiphilaceae bacterium]|nr:hotdog domain-containing protein [Oleiphilaceae bacterium]